MAMILSPKSPLTLDYKGLNLNTEIPLTASVRQILSLSRNPNFLWVQVRWCVAFFRTRERWCKRCFRAVQLFSFVFLMKQVTKRTLYFSICTNLDP